MERERIHRRLLQWYRYRRRPLLWRQRSWTPYEVLVREVMLQQTQSSRVEQALPAFLQRFPTLQALAAAPLADVLQQWAGLGYYARARALWRCARLLLERYGATIPEDERLLRRLPGIGPYTSAALLVFAFGRQDVPLIDTNIRRVLLRVTGLAATPPAPAQLRELARAWIPTGASAEWHEALMDLGATICTARHPRCSECPIAQWCRSAHRVPPPPPRSARREPEFAGLPRRLWRGRLLRLLVERNPLPLKHAAELLFGSAPSVEQRRWLLELVAALERDGLLDCRNGILCLPNAPQALREPIPSAGEPR
jgi:A/G-specific adenine glycosylase